MPPVLVLLSQNCLNILRVAIRLINFAIVCTFIDGKEFSVLFISCFFKLKANFLICAISHYITESRNLHAVLTAAPHFLRDHTIICT